MQFVTFLLDDLTSSPLIPLFPSPIGEGKRGGRKPGSWGKIEFAYKKTYPNKYYFTGKYPTFVTIDCPSSLSTQSTNAFTSPSGLALVYMKRNLVIG
jgi:hypothetical protein